ncbi:MAG: GntR family transcriptional regulator [Myxococcota bacterium]|nr:GntR family transcriptional regulator [Myxococcota bacterium]
MPLNPSSGLPLYLQVAMLVREQVASGVLEVGAPTPSLRNMAARLRVNIHTVAKAYQLLEREGLLVRQRGDPYRVADTGDVAGELLRQDIEALVARAESLKLPPERVLQLVEAALYGKTRKHA